MAIPSGVVYMALYLVSFLRYSIMLVQVRNVLPPLPCLTLVAENPVKFPNDLWC